MIRFKSTLKGAHVTLSSNDTVATCTSSAIDESAICLPGTNPWNSTKEQKVYMEFAITTGDGGAGGMAVGMCKDVDTNTWLGAPGRDSFGYWSDGSVIANNSTLFTGSTYTTGDRICIAWDNKLARAWVRKNGGSWNAGGTADPTTGVGSIQMDAAAANAIRNFAAEPGDSGTVGVVTLKSRKADWAQAAPTGFTELGRSVVQCKAGGNSTSSVTPTFDYAVTPGNTLLLAVASDAYVSSWASGFAADANCSFESGSGNNMGWAAVRKTAVGSDTVSYTMTGTANSAWVIVELEGLDATTPFNIAAGGFTNGASGVQALSRTATPTGTADIVGIFFGGNAVTDAGVNTNSWPTVLDGGDELVFGGFDTVLRYSAAAVAYEGTAPTAITGGATTNATSSGNHAVGSILMLFNLASAGGVASGTLTSAGAAVASFVGKAKAKATMSSAGLSLAAFTGKAKAKGTLAITAVGAAAFVAKEKFYATLSASGSAVASFVGTAAGKSSLQSIGAATVNLVGKAKANTVLAGVGSAVASFIGRAPIKAPFNSTGASTANFGSKTNKGSLAAGGTSTASFVGRASGVGAVDRPGYPISFTIQPNTLFAAGQTEVNPSNS